jgi:hypothetical protein
MDGFDWQGGLGGRGRIGRPGTFGGSQQPKAAPTAPPSM